MGKKGGRKVDKIPKPSKTWKSTEPSKENGYMLTPEEAMEIVCEHVYDLLQNQRETREAHTIALSVLDGIGWKIVKQRD